MDEADDRIDELERRRREARRAVEEAGGGESEGFELAEQELIEHASHGDQHTPTRIMLDAASQRETAGAVDGEADEGVYGDADEEHKPD
ncbi:MAG TPA: hypothetical protein VK765_01480 [Solirubrobacteraceae bacterium]|jgi:hypothetical protein|nr:hypothetical protein [Solirubrobacteraceae bacterium]